MQEATDDLGCCLSRFADRDRFSHSDTVLTIWALCNVEIPESCLAACERAADAFLEGLPGGNCLSDFLAVVYALGNATDGEDATDDQLEALKDFCRDCADAYADFVADDDEYECDGEDIADDVREHCSVSPAPDGRLCGEYVLRQRETFSDYNLDTCSGGCTTECRAAVQEATDDLGCCLSTFSDSAYSDYSDTVQTIWTQCNVEIPEGCVGDDDEDMSDEAIGALPTAVLVGLGAIGCALYW